MGKDEKEDSGFGFKDRAKAEETLKLLEQHDPGYRRLTVRGLLGRAKRVLSMTKAEEKINNIKEAMEVFEKWIADLEKNKPPADKKEKKQDRKRSSEKDSNSEDSEESREALPSESVSGLGFKDEEAAQASLRVLEGRDPDYQQLAIKGLLRSAKRVLTCTRDETKLANIKAGMDVLEQFLDDFESQHLSRQNCPYLPLGIVRTAAGLAGGTLTETQKSFVAAYAGVRGEYKRLRNVPGEGTTWDILRNAALKELKEKHADAKLFNENDEPTKEHLDFLLWAYSPEAARVKKVMKETKEDKLPTISSLEIEQKGTEEKRDRKRKSSVEDESQSKKKKE